MPGTPNTNSICRNGKSQRGTGTGISDPVGAMLRQDHLTLITGPARRAVEGIQECNTAKLKDFPEPWCPAAVQAGHLFSVGVSCGRVSACLSQPLGLSFAGIGAKDSVYIKGVDTKEECEFTLP